MTSCPYVTICLHVLIFQPQVLENESGTNYFLLKCDWIIKIKRKVIFNVFFLSVNEVHLKCYSLKHFLHSILCTKSIFLWNFCLLIPFFILFKVCSIKIFIFWRKLSIFSCDIFAQWKNVKTPKTEKRHNLSKQSKKYEVHTIWNIYHVFFMFLYISL